MQDVAGAVHDGTGPRLRDLAVALDFPGAVGNDEEFLFGVPMRGVRRCAGIQNGHAGAHPTQLVGRPVVVHEHSAAALNVWSEPVEVHDAVGELLRPGLDAHNRINGGISHTPDRSTSEPAGSRAGQHPTYGDLVRQYIALNKMQ